MEILDFYQGILIESRDRHEIYAATALAVEHYDYHLCMVIEYALLCAPLEGHQRVEWCQVYDVLKALGVNQ